MSVGGGERAEPYTEKRSLRELIVAKRKAGLCDPEDQREQILLFF